MDNAPTEAATPAPSEATVATPTNNNTEPAQAPEQSNSLGLTAEQVEQFKTFMANNGGFESAFKKLKTDISTPKSAQPAEPASVEPAQPARATQPVQPAPQPPKGAITREEWFVKQYYKDLASEEKYAPIAKELMSGAYLTKMSSLGVQAFNEDGSINDSRVRDFLDIMLQTVPASTTSVEPNESPAPTVEYYQVEGDKITDMNQAYAIIDQDMKLKAKGQAGHPLATQAEDFIRNRGKAPQK